MTTEDNNKKDIKSTNRKWQNHLKSKGPIAFFYDRMKTHALTNSWQYANGPFEFLINDRENDDQLTKSFFEMSEYFPYEFYIEITNKCNLACKMCARTSMNREQGIMSEKLFRKIIDEISCCQPYANIHYYGIGESLLDPNLFEKLDYVKSKGLKNSILFSNGQLLLDNNNYQKLVNSGISSIGIDLDGFSDDTYNQIRIGGNFQKAKQSIIDTSNYINSINANTRLEIAYQIYPNINDHEIEVFVDWCNLNQYEYKLVTMHTWAGLRSDVPKTDLKGLKDPNHTTRKNPCSLLWSGFMILWNGKVSLCFQDADLQECLGDLNCNSIQDIWMTSHLKKRKNHVRGNFDGLCSNCSSETEVVLPKINSKLYPNSLL